MENILTIENFKLAFNSPDGKVSAVKGVSLSVNKGETLALVGESGCGKTALCRSILRLHSAHASVEGGKIILCGKDITEAPEKEMEKIRGKDVSMIFQDPMSSLNPTFSIGLQIAEPLMIHEGLSKKEAKEKAIFLLEKVGISEAAIRFNQFPHHFSGGMRQRVAIAIALACNPKLVIADEPTTSLDADTQNKIMALFKDISKREEKAMIFVTHDLGLAKNMADKIAVMKDGIIIEEGTCKEIFENPKEEYTKALIRYSKYGKGDSHYHGHINEPFEGEESLVSIKNLSKTFSLGRKKKNKVLSGFNLEIRRGEILGIVGNSGCGKSTLARCIMQVYPIDGGTITFNGEVKKQMIFQDSASAFNPRMTLEEIIAEPLILENKRVNKGELAEKVRRVARQVELDEELLGRYPYDVSGGQRQRAAIGRALITRPNFIIADEPISSLDVSIQAQIIHLLKKIHDENDLTIMIIAHDLPMVEHISDRIIKM